MNKLILIINCGLFCLYGGHSRAQQVNSELTSSDVTLIIKPNICVAPRNNRDCISTIDISWSSTRSGDYCLRTGREQLTLQCWQAVDSGFYKHKIRIQEDLSYWITDIEAHIKWVKSTVRFARLKPHRKHSRRSRLPWSIQSL